MVGSNEKAFLLCNILNIRPCWWRCFACFASSNQRARFISPSRANPIFKKNSSEKV
jgi:hypothetical protein